MVQAAIELCRSELKDRISEHIDKTLRITSDTRFHKEGEVRWEGRVFLGYGIDLHAIKQSLMRQIWMCSSRKRKCHKGNVVMNRRSNESEED